MSPIFLGTLSLVLVVWGVIFVFVGNEVTFMAALTRQRWNEESNRRERIVGECLEALGVIMVVAGVIGLTATALWWAWRAT